MLDVAPDKQRLKQLLVLFVIHCGNKFNELRSKISENGQQGETKQEKRVSFCKKRKDDPQEAAAAKCQKITGVLMIDGHDWH